MQRRSLRATSNFQKNHIIKEGDFLALRPCPVDAVPPSESNNIIGRSLLVNINQGDYLRLCDIAAS